MPGQVLKLVSSRHYHSADDLARCNLAPRAPVIKHRATELFEVMRKAREDFQTARSAVQEARLAAPTQAAEPQLSSTAGTSGSNRFEALAVSTPAPVPSMEDVWGDIVAKPAAKSSLFGSTISGSSASKAPKFASKPKTSGLFGKTISGSNSNSKGPKMTSFDDVRNSIFNDFLPTVLPGITSREPAPEPFPEAAIAASSSMWPSNGSAAGPIDIDQSSSSRSNIPTEMPEVHEPSPPKKLKRDEIVQVKKRSRKPKDTTSSSSAIATTSSDSVAPTTETKKEKSSKKRLAGADIPEFDYTKAPNLLDNPRSGIKDAGKKKRKEKKERKGTPSFSLLPCPLGIELIANRTARGRLWTGAKGKEQYEGR